MKQLLPVPHNSLCAQLDPNHSHANPAMEQNSQNKIHSHSAAQNREETWVATSQQRSKLDAKQFGAMLDVYDKNMCSHVLSSISVPKPVEMIKKLEARKKKEKAQGEGRSECCDYLNHLITLLPSM